METLEQAYQESLDYLYSFVDFSMKRHVDDAHRFFKLDRMHKLMHLLGDPQDKFPSIHIAGTKGKGSVAAMCASILISAGYKVGLYTSPHLEEYTERIQVNGQQISKERLVQMVAELRPIAALVEDVTTFELTTALGFQYFLESGVDIAVIEVGLGGRLDATNIITPLVSVITPISYDHTAVLGNTLTEIAYEKAGIIKPAIPVVVAPQVDEARIELERVALERGSQIIHVKEAYIYREIEHNLKQQEIKIYKKSNEEDGSSSLARTPLKIKLPLLGYHQVENSATAVAALDVVAHKGFSIKRQALLAGFKEVFWPARFEILQAEPPVIIDSAHNGESMQRLREALDHYFPSTDFVLIFGASADKELESIFENILPRVSLVVATRSQHPRAADPENLAEKIRTFGKTVFVGDPAEDALELAQNLAGTNKGILVTGSIFIAAAARSIWKKHHDTK